MANLKTLSLTAAFAAISLAGCDNAQKTGGMASSGDSHMCVPFATATTTTTTTTTAGQPPVVTTAPAIGADPSAGLEDCLHRWGYALAASRDDASQVAAATVAACSPSLSRWNQSALAQSDAGGPQEAPSLVSGQPTTPIGEHFIFAQGRALFYVVQARAGKCSAPPMTNGAPTGLIN
jgi:hypothetical protein